MSGMWKTVRGFPKEQDHKKAGYTVLTPNTANKTCFSEGHGNMK